MIMREIEDLSSFDRAVAENRAKMVVQGVDLRARTEALLALEGQHVFVGCELEAPAMFALISKRNVVLPPIEGLPFRPFRPTLYSPDELYRGLVLDGRGYEETPDRVAYLWYQRAMSEGALLDQMAMALHDQSMTDTLDELLDGRRVAAVMGGHKMMRGTEAYRDAALLGRSLARAGLVVATGGRPGAMEAANLGAYMAEHPDAALDEAIAILCEAKDFHDSIGAWAAAAMRVRQRFQRSSDAVPSVGIPTWYYGHEPPNAFASHVAKYFSNAIREDGLLLRANVGIAFLRGAAGTVQELFQDGAQNYYAPREKVALAVLVGQRYWTEEMPAWPLITALGRGREMGSKLRLVDTVHEAASVLTAGA
jgi:predicted Rossmann-fold nucleotide-binding protein